MRLSDSMIAVRYSVAGTDRPGGGHRPLRELDPTEVRNRPALCSRRRAVKHQGASSLMITFYLDESGHSGDMVNGGEPYDFKGQPYFVLAAVGIENEAAMASCIAELRQRHKIAPGELKSKSLQAKPKFIVDLFNDLYERRAPLFVELVDKRYFICVHIASFQLLPTLMGFQESHGLRFIRNTIADFLYIEASDQVLNAFVEACLTPSETMLLESFSQLEELGNTCRDMPENGDIAKGLLQMVEQALIEYREHCQGNDEAYLRFLPPPDYNKHNKCVWMLPNLTSFTNIYARLNLFYGRNLKGVRIVHDQQLEVEDILRLGKATAEGLREADSIPYTPHSDFLFAETASFEFAQSHEATGIQLADVVAGTVMRYFRDSPRTVIDPDLDRVMRKLIGESDGLTGYGINQVVPWCNLRLA